MLATWPTLGASLHSFLSFLDALINGDLTLIESLCVLPVEDLDLAGRLRLMEVGRGWLVGLLVVVVLSILVLL